MWLIVPLLILLVFILIGGALVGGIYADVLIPIVVLVLIGISALVMMRRRPREGGRPPRNPGDAGVPPPVGGGQSGADTGPAPATPEDMLKERQGS